MSTLRYKLIYATVNRATTLIDTSIHNNIHKQFEFEKQTVLADKILTNDEKTYAIRWLTKDYDRDKIHFNSGTKRICENCNQECLATLYCEYCKCQMESLMPNMVVEWIPYSNLKNINYLTKGGFSEIYTADWIYGWYNEWDSEENQLKRVERPGIQNIVANVVLKKLENVESANQSWFEEAKSHLTINNKWASVVRCYEKAIHRDLHSGNILYSQFNNSWCVSDLGFCGPADKSSTSIYGNLPYIAPEVI
ncbi:hypothetical protein C1646_768308, partial [Rhizophagus diaphanus]